MSNGNYFGIYGPSKPDASLSGMSPTFEKGAFKYLAISPRRASRAISHPIEDGSVRFDNKVVDPFTVSVVGTVYSSDTATKDKIKKMVETRAWGFYTIVGYENDAYPTCTLLSASHRQSAETPDAQDYTLEFQEIKVVKAKEMPMTRVPDDQPTKSS